MDRVNHAFSSRVSASCTSRSPTSLDHGRERESDSRSCPDAQQKPGGCPMTAVRSKSVCSATMVYQPPVYRRGSVFGSM